MDKKKTDTIFSVILVVFFIAVVILKFTLGRTNNSYLYDIPTCQAFKVDKVPGADVAKIVQAGINAPSGMNRQPWFFAVVDDENVTRAIADGIAAVMADRGMTPPANAVQKAQLADAPLAVHVYCEPQAMLDAGLALEQMNVAAQSLGYGTKIFGSPAMVLKGENADKYKNLLGVPDTYEYAATLAIGKIDRKAHKQILDAMSGATARKSGEDVYQMISR